MWHSHDLSALHIRPLVPNTQTVGSLPALFFLVFWWLSWVLLTTTNFITFDIKLLVILMWLATPWKMSAVQNFNNTKKFFNSVPILSLFLFLNFFLSMSLAVIFYICYVLSNSSLKTYFVNLGHSHFLSLWHGIASIQNGPSNIFTKYMKYVLLKNKSNFQKNLDNEF